MRSDRETAIEAALREASWVLPLRPTDDEYRASARATAESLRTKPFSALELAEAITVWAEEVSAFAESPTQRARSLPGPVALSRVAKTRQAAQRGSTAVSGDPLEEEQLEVHPLIPKIHNAWGSWCSIRGGHERLSKQPHLWPGFRENRQKWWQWMPKTGLDVINRQALDEPIEFYMDGMAKGLDFDAVHAEATA